jgi:hypothetical protein
MIGPVLDSSRAIGGLVKSSVFCPLHTAAIPPSTGGKRRRARNGQVSYLRHETPPMVGQVSEVNSDGAVT